MERQNPGGMPGGVHFQWHGGPGGPDLNTIFQQFGFGGGDPFAQFRHPQTRRNKDLRVDIPLPLVTTLQEQTKTISVQTTNGHRETLEVKIPKGVTNGTTIKYSGLGDNLFNTIPRGDLYVQVNVHGAENFIVNDIDLHTKISVNCLTAITGGDATVNGLDGKTFVLAIPAGMQPGVKFRISGEGLYRLNTDQRGDLYAEMTVYIPKNLTEDQLQTIKLIATQQ
jgi:DnaJ-class molecular chaperone